MRISDWSSDVCSSDLGGVVLRRPRILNLRVLVTAKRTAHEPPSPSGATAAPAAVAAQLPTLSLDRHVRVDRDAAAQGFHLLAHFLLEPPVALRPVPLCLAGEAAQHAAAAGAPLLHLGAPDPPRGGRSRPT